MTALDFIDKHPWFTTLWLLIVVGGFVRAVMAIRGDSCDDCGVDSNDNNEGDSGDRE